MWLRIRAPLRQAPDEAHEDARSVVPIVKRAKKVGFRTRSKTPGGRRIIKRKRKRTGGYFRVG